MVLREEATSKDLSTTRDERLAKRRIERHERYLTLLRLAYRTRVDNDYDSTKIDDVIRQAEDELDALNRRGHGRILQRGRPKKKSSETCTVFIDECGAHSLRAKEHLTTFALAAVVIRDREYRAVDTQWKAWKRAYLGSSTKQVHEPDIRRGKGSFYCDGDASKRERAVSALPRVLERLPFTAIVCVVNRPEYLATFGHLPMDDSLPTHPYIMTLHFLAERIALALEHELEGARARVVVESRGEHEDATLQYEFARLFLDGTTYISGKWFRQAFLPGLEFRSKRDNETGLQLADLVARPCADKVMNPGSTPARWTAVRRKLCGAQITQHSPIGIKIVPWDEKYEGLWES